MRRTLATIGLVVGLLAAAAPPAGALPTTCFGRTPTIAAVAGVPTVGTAGDDVILGTGGDDLIDGGAGDDLICGVGGDDTLDGGRGADLIDGGYGADTIGGGLGPDVIDGGPGPDLINGGLGDDTLDGGGGDDVLVGARHDDLLEGGPGEDELYGGPGEDDLRGGDRDDFLNGGAAGDLLDGGPGGDAMEGRRGGDVLTGGEGTDDLRAGPGIDECIGEELRGCEIAPVSPGDRGYHVRYLQIALSRNLLYRGPVDGTYPDDAWDKPGDMTAAVYAFHKLHRDPLGARWDRESGDYVSPEWTLQDWARLEAFDPAAPKERTGEPNRVEVDARREVMWLILGGEVAGIFHVSIGGEYFYWLNGEPMIAHTPRGDWDFDRYSYGRKVAGYQYKSWYFEQDYFAVHGFWKVPPYPASHGCVRVTYDEADWLTLRLKIGWPIHVWDH